MKTVLSNNGVTTETFYSDGDSFVIERVQDVAPILEYNKQRAAEGHNKKAAFRHAASVPVEIWDQWMREFKTQRGYDYGTAKPEEKRKFTISKLNDGDNELFRTWKGRL